MNKDTLKEASQIINNILEQPLSIPGATPDISLLKAALSFKKEDPNSDMYKIIQSFIEYPENTKTLITELELILNDIRK